MNVTGSRGRDLWSLQVSQSYRVMTYRREETTPMKMEMETETELEMEMVMEMVMEMGVAITALSRCNQCRKKATHRYDFEFNSVFCVNVAIYNNAYSMYCIIFLLLLHF